MADVRDALSAALKKRAKDEGETATRRERSSQVMAREARLLIVGAPVAGYLMLDPSQRRRLKRAGRREIGR